MVTTAPNLSQKPPISDTSSDHVAGSDTMAADTEALRAQFEQWIVNRWSGDRGMLTCKEDGRYWHGTVDFAHDAYQAGHAAGINGSPIIGLVSNIRAAAGDPLGELDWDELVTHIAGLRVKAETAEVGEPLFWYRPRSDDGYEGPLHHTRMCRVRKESGGWVPLFTAAQVAAAAAKDRERSIAAVEDKIASVMQANPGRGGRVNSAVAFALDLLRECADAIRAGAKEPSDA